MTLEQLISLYAPLAGLLGVVFWLGMVTQRVLQLERSTERREQRVVALEHGNATDRDERDRLVRLENEMEHHGKQLDHLSGQIDKLGNAVEGIHRQLANIAMGRTGQVIELGKA